MERRDKEGSEGLADYGLGEVQEVGTNFIVTLMGTISKHKYFSRRETFRFWTENLRLLSVLP
jgi:hypothetical protein